MKKLKCFMVIIFGCNICAGQQVISSGGHSVKSDYSVNWILGGSLSDIHPDPATLIKIQKEELTESVVAVKIYPVPAGDFVKIEIARVDTGRLVIELYNNAGIKCFSKPFAYTPVIELGLTNFPSGVYLMKIVSPSCEQQLFETKKIIKK